MAVGGQVSKYKRERDTYKSMLEGAQRTIGDLKRKCRSGDGAAEGNASDAADVSQLIQRSQRDYRRREPAPGCS